MRLLRRNNEAKKLMGNHGRICEGDKPADAAFGAEWRKNARESRAATALRWICARRSKAYSTKQALPCDLPTGI